MVCSFKNVLTLLTLCSLILLGCDKTGPKAGQPKASSSPPPKPFAQKVEQAAFHSIDEAVQKLVEQADAGQTRQQDKAASWLTAQGEAVIDPLSAILSDEKRSVESRVAACQVLSQLGAPARPVLMRTTASPTQMVRLSATRRLGLIRPADEATIAHLITMLQHEDKTTRRAAVASLGSIGTEADAATEALVGIYNNGQLDELLRNAAFAALKRIHPRRDFTDLLDD